METTRHPRNRVPRMAPDVYLTAARRLLNNLRGGRCRVGLS